MVISIYLLVTRNTRACNRHGLVRNVGTRTKADDTDNVAIRRKVGGLPPHLTIFELGFAGKGRIYYTRGKQRRFRILSVGAKNSQKADLDYLRKLTL